MQHDNRYMQRNVRRGQRGSSNQHSHYNNTSGLSDIIKDENELERLTKVITSAIGKTNSHQLRRILNHVKKEWHNLKEEESDLPLLKNKLVLVLEYGRARKTLDDSLVNVLEDIVKNNIKTTNDAEIFRDYIVEIPVAYAKK